jgi:hypothetical protein
MRLRVMLSKAPDGTVEAELAFTDSQMERMSEAWAERLEAERTEILQADSNPLCDVGLGVLTIEIPDGDVEAAFRRGAIYVERGGAG